MDEAGPAIEGTLLGAIAGGGEGLMLKFLDTRCAYEPSRRADSWLKLKKDYCEGLRDSLDLVRLLIYPSLLVDHKTCPGAFRRPALHSQSRQCRAAQRLQ